MQSFDMLMTGPVYSGSAKRYFIDGVRVTRAAFDQMRKHCRRQDSFHTSVSGDRYQYRSVCHV